MVVTGRWVVAVVIAGAFVAAYVADQIPLIAVGMGVVMLVAVVVAGQGSNPWLNLAATAFFTGVVVETFRAVVGSSAFQPGAALLFGLVLAFFLWVFQRPEKQRGQTVQPQPE